MFIKKFFKLKLVKINSKIYKTKPSCKLLKFRSKNADILSDADTTSLLLGVINLIKNNAIKKTEFLLNREVEYYKKISSNSITKIYELEQEIKKLKGS